MSNFKHTQGNWKYFKSGNFIAAEQSGLEDDPTICIVKNDCDGKLLASAPKLLEALIEAQEALQWFMSNSKPDNDDHESFFNIGANAISKARDAITKATS